MSRSTRSSSPLAGHQRQVAGVVPVQAQVQREVAAAASADDQEGQAVFGGDTGHQRLAPGHPRPPRTGPRRRPPPCGPGPATPTVPGLCSGTWRPAPRPSRSAGTWRPSPPDLGFMIRNGCRGRTAGLVAGTACGLPVRSAVVAGPGRSQQPGRRGTSEHAPVTTAHAPIAANARRVRRCRTPRRQPSGRARRGQASTGRHGTGTTSSRHAPHGQQRNFWPRWPADQIRSPVGHDRPRRHPVADRHLTSGRDMADEQPSRAVQVRRLPAGYCPCPAGSPLR
jgi:hypothetical protein